MQAYYIPNKDRPNLTVLIQAHVLKVLTENDPSGKLKALGVLFQYQDQTHETRVKREVILSAG